jgi:iron complex outermembrane receptor protein
MTKTFRHRLIWAASAIALMAPAIALAQTNDGAKPEVEVPTVVVTAVKGRAAEAAPVKSNIAAAEPEAVITRKFIEEAAPRVGDYTTTAILAPSMTTVPNSNGSGSTDGAKISLRGFADGQFNVTYDGIAWGDTNGPSHHSNSFFPSSVIGGVVIDRGPGRASDFGQANFGGSVNLFSLPFEDRPAVRQTLTAGSFGTGQSVTTLATGPVAALHDANFVFNFMEYTTDGYLTNSPSSGQNQFIKATVPMGEKVTLTALFTRNEDDYNQGDASANATVAQTQLYGTRFALSNDPSLPTYKGYNYTRKQTDFEYIRLNADFGHGLTFDNTVYSYYYANHTLSANNDGADYSLDPTYVNGIATGGNYAATYNASVIGANLKAADLVTLFPNNTPNVAYPKAGSGYSSSLKVAGIPGYTKRNEYRVTGDIVKFYQDTPWGKLSFGAEFEQARTQRERFDYDLGPGLGLSALDYREKAAVYANASTSGHCSYPIQASNGACEIPLDVQYSEFSGWNQWQPYAEFDWKPTDQITITPGVKYVDFRLYIHAPILNVKGSQQPSYVDGAYTKTLPFLTANYRFRPNWSFYAQYAQGFLVPDISSFYVNVPANNRVVPQESTNYQFGTVLSYGQFTFDGDVYYIDFKHKIQQVTDLVTNESYSTNSGGATYKGIELQGTYLLPYGFSTFGNFSVNQALGENDPNATMGNGKQLAKAPRGTAALGLRYERHGLITTGDDIVTNLNTKWIGQQLTNAATNTAPTNGLIHSFNETNWTTTYKLGHYSVEFQVLNLFDHRAITSFKGSGLVPGTNLPATSTAQANTLALANSIAANVFTYQVERSFQLTLKAAF